MEGVEITFNLPPMDPAERDAHCREVFHVFLQDGLQSGDVVPSPRIQVEEGGVRGGG